MAKVASVDSYRVSAEQFLSTKVERDIIPCTLSIDSALSGGIPLGSMTVIGGKSKSGKTSICLRWGANAQKLYGSKIFYFNIEGRLSKLVIDQTQGIKLDKDHFEVITPPPIRSDGNIIGYEKWSAERWWKEIGETIEQNRKAVIIVDSISNMSSEAEMTEDMGKQERGTRQKLEAQFCRKYGPLAVANEIALMCLAQIQANTSGYGAAIQMKVGNGIKHQADTIIFIKSTRKYDVKEGERVQGHFMECLIECSAMGPPYVEVDVPLRFGSGIDTLKDIIEQCINWDIIKKAGAWYTLPFFEKENEIIFDLETKEGLKVQGEEKIRNWLLVRPEQVEILNKTVREKLML